MQYNDSIEGYDPPVDGYPFLFQEKNSVANFLT